MEGLYASRRDGLSCGNYLKPHVRERLFFAFKQGWSVRRAAAYAPCSKGTASRFTKIARAGGVKCPCGQVASHQGWCSWRYQQSARRQAFIRQWRPDRRVGVRVRKARVPKPPRQSVVWPFIVDTPNNEHALLLQINRLVPKWIAEQMRQDICQDVAVRVLSGDTLTPNLVHEVLKAGRKQYGLRWDEISLHAWTSRTSETSRWVDVLSAENPILRFRPKTEPTCSSSRAHRSGPPVPLRVKRGYVRGASHHGAKLTESDVLAIRHMYHSGRYSQDALGREFGVSQSVIYCLVTGSSWRHVGGPIYTPEKDKQLVRTLVSAGWDPVGAHGWNMRTEQINGITDMAQSGFSEFWSLYPKRVAKLAAMRAYDHARTIASASDILAGVQNYITHLPNDAKYIAYPASWLNAGRWMDEYSEPTVNPSADEDWFSECRELHGGTCGGSLRHRNKMLIEHRKRDAS